MGTEGFNDAKARCSTPYGIRGFAALKLFDLARRLRVRCSTPYGIRGFAVMPESLAWTGDPGAQRLTASEVSQRGKCILTMMHPDNSAQRLTASEVSQSPARGSTGRVITSAQRLTASEVSQGFVVKVRADLALCSTPYGIRGFAVPYALQHRIIAPVCSTPYGIRGFADFTKECGFEVYSVLNALRHQRFRSASVTCTFGCDSLCSTPYGIRGFAGRFGSGLYALWPVLNALRHQRFRRSNRGDGSASRASAQRLTASEVSQPGGTASIC